MSGERTTLPILLAPSQYDAVNEQQVRSAVEDRLRSVEFELSKLTTDFTGVITGAGVFLPAGAAINWDAGDVTITHSANSLAFEGAANGFLFGNAVAPVTNDLAPLGSAAVSWSDLFLASGGVINFNAGNYTLTHSAGLLTANGALSIGTTNALTAGSIELGAATDTTITRSAAGAIAVEGVAVILSGSSPSFGTITTTGTIELGNATDTTLARSAAGVVTIEGVRIVTDVNSYTEDTAPDGTADFLLTYDASASAHKKVKPINLTRVGGWQFLNSGTVSAATSLDIVLTAYTAYRAIGIELTHVIPATNATDLYLRTSTNGGSTYHSGASDYQWCTAIAFTTAWGLAGSTADTKMVLNRNDTATQHISNSGTVGGWNGFIILHDPTYTAGGTNCTWTFDMFSDGASHCMGNGGGLRTAAADVDAIRFLMSSGNIASAKWAIYGLI